MKKILLCGLFVMLFLLAGRSSFLAPQTAYAWDTNDPHNYVIPNSIYLDHTGNLVIDWARGIAGGIGGAPGGYLSLSINGTSTDGTALLAQSNGQPGYCRQAPDTFGSKSQSNFGNQNVFGSISDANAGHAVSTQGITSQTPIYINMYGDIPYYNPYQYCFAVGTSYAGFSGPYYINFSAEQLTPIFLQPFQGEVMSDFPAWIVDLSVNVPPATGTLLIHYGDLDSNTFPTIDRIPYDVECNGACDESVQVPKSEQLQFPQQNTSTQWWAYAEVQNTSTNLDIQSQVVSFFINPNAPQYAPAPSSSFVFGPGLGAASTTATCQFTTASFVDDPVGNTEQAICNVFNFLFIPNSSEQADLYQRFHGQWDQLSNRVPFGYVGIITTAFANFHEGTNTSTLISTTTYAALSGVLSPLKTGISFLLILLLGFSIFHFARNINL